MSTDNDIHLGMEWKDGVGEISDEAFTTSLPDGLTDDHFEQVDAFRDAFAAAAVEEMLEQGPAWFEENPDTNLAIAECSLGGNTVFEATLAPDGMATAAITTDKNEALDAVYSKAREIFGAVENDEAA